jgi:hypothetical protein
MGQLEPSDARFVSACSLIRKQTAAAETLGNGRVAPKQTFALRSNSLGSRLEDPTASAIVPEQP